MSGTSDVTLELDSSPELLCVARDTVRSYLNSLGFPEDRVLEVVLAVDEVCSNAVRHAYGGEPGHTYSVSMSCQDEWLKIEISDDGVPAPARVAEEKPAPQTIDEATIGGYGIQIVRQVCDEVKFETREPRGNLVTVKVKCSQ